METTKAYIDRSVEGIHLTRQCNRMIGKTWFHLMTMSSYSGWSTIIITKRTRFQTRVLEFFRIFIPPNNIIIFRSNSMISYSFMLRSNPDFTYPIHPQQINSLTGERLLYIRLWPTNSCGSHRTFLQSHVSDVSQIASHKRWPQQLTASWRSPRLAITRFIAQSLYLRPPLFWPLACYFHVL